MNLSAIILQPLENAQRKSEIYCWDQGWGNVKGQSASWNRDS